ncbi:putative short chain dehydrogenase/ reductase [Daldinia loculata]|uniref:putative short chain dehydrogenase/ reductase n=1 Tax=Daldinia loculata TaxID=103429 RepID=UPI0020C2CB17|nr:putative short chain dehydrogenase/ reductase [Daldinia loculata]KAI1648986.1 putative short chain dehydrogenase/ reductase [Daldinia loculata]KAI2780424.1 putative short chain dehydrogenase/ reductase [Daldinia loculata]
MPPIAGQTLLVIGGTSGIGAAVAKLAAAEGLDVSVASSNPLRVKSAVKAIQDAVPVARINGYVCDVNHDDAESSIEQLLSDVTNANGRPLDHIVYTAVVLDVRPVADVNMKYLRDSTQFGYVVPLLIAKLAPRYVNQSYKSSLTFTSGRVAERPVKGMAVASGWGASLFGTTRGLALDLAPVRVNLVSPGATDTKSGEEWTRWVEMMAKTALLGKIGTPEEVAEAYIYLMKDTNSTGSCLSTNGGILVQ